MTPWRFSHLSDPKILVVRNDGLGDFLLTLPLVAALKQQLPAARIYGLVSHHLKDLVPLLPDFEGAILDEGCLLKRHRKLFSRAERRQKRRRLAEEIRAQRFDLAVLPYAERASAALVQRAGVPRRAGPLRRLFFWRFNVHNSVSRKRSGAAEYELNLTYLKTLWLEEAFAAPRLQPPAPGSCMPRGGRGYVVIHPHKRSGTALTWPMANFVALAGELLAAGLHVAVIGDEPDGPVLREHFGKVEGARLVIGEPLPRLVALIAGARLFVGNSSGPLHLAGLAGTPHIGFYPQNRVSSPRRWRTLPVSGAPPHPDSYLLGPDFPKSCVTCEMEKCAYFNCVAGIPMERVREGVRAWGLRLNTPAGKTRLRATGS